MSSLKPEKLTVRLTTDMCVRPATAHLRRLTRTLWRIGYYSTRKVYSVNAVALTTIEHLSSTITGMISIST